MKNLESYDVQIMNTKEVKQISGGLIFTTTVVIYGTLASFGLIGAIWYANKNS